MRARLVIIGLTCLYLVACAAAPKIGDTSIVEFRNGRWFDGSKFISRSYYAVNGTLTERRRGQPTASIDLDGAFVIPPFGEAHNHNLTGIEAWDRAAVRNYLNDGVFYVQIQGNLPLDDAAKTRLGLNTRLSVDATFAQGSLTATGGHPIALAENVLLPRGYYPGFTKETLKNHLYFTVDRLNDLEIAWPLLLAQKPDFVKAFLVYSDEFATRAQADRYFGARGLDPSLLRDIAKKAHASGLRLSVHVANARDFRNAVLAGADQIAHLPPLPVSVPGVAALELLTKEDAFAAASRKVVVITTASAVARSSRLTEDERNRYRAAQIENLKQLKAAGVRLAVGSDDVTDTSRKEVEYLRGLAVFSNVELLRMWTYDTPIAIFPSRRIGQLREGYEANFLVLGGNPLDDWENLYRITMRFKQGVRID